MRRHAQTSRSGAGGERDVRRTGGFGGEPMILLSPVFFSMAAKRAMHKGRTASIIAFAGLLLGAGGLWAALSQPVPPPNAPSSAPFRP